jgi:ribosomal protein S18 acetylase RimI-like enzyme
MFSLRSLVWPGDRPAILAIDTSFTTGRVYRVLAMDEGFILRAAPVSPPLHKVYDLAREVELFPALDYVLIAEVDAQVAGVAALSHDRIDRRAILMHLYVSPTHRRQGIGRALIAAMVEHAREWQARCLWLETQDVNYSAIQFYRRLGFQWCGLDLSLDEHDGSASDETAVFFMRRL